MQTLEKDNIKLTGSAELDLQSMGIPMEKAMVWIREAICGSKGKRKQLIEAKGITEAKLKLEDGRWLGVLFVPEPDATYWVAKVHWTSHEEC